MTVALPLWGYEIDGKAMFIFIAIYLFVSLLLGIFFPKRAVPIRSREDDDGYPIELTPEERDKIIDDMRVKVRSAVIQITGGVLVVAGFIGAMQGIRGTVDAFDQKKADLFASGRTGHEALEAAILALIAD